MQKKSPKKISIGLFFILIKCDSPKINFTNKLYIKTCTESNLYSTKKMKKVIILRNIYYMRLRHVAYLKININNLV